MVGGKRKQSQKKSHQIELEREEVRGIFVLGIVATLLSMKDILTAWGFAQTFVNTIEAILSWLVVPWGVYALFMALTVSGEGNPPWINARIARFSHNAAEFLFLYGLSVFVAELISVAVFIVISYAWSVKAALSIDAFLFPWGWTAIAILFMFLIGHWKVPPWKKLFWGSLLRRRPRKNIPDNQRSQQT
jgi:hypothetical protein